MPGRSEAMRLAYLTLDVFKERRFGDKVLAVRVGDPSVPVMEGVLTV